MKTKILEKDAVSASKKDLEEIFKKFNLKQFIKIKCDCCEKVFETHLRNLKIQVICKTCKTKRTNLLKYGVENPFQSKEIQNKARETCKKKFGVENISSLESCKKLKSENFKKKTSEEKDLIKKKRACTNKKLYGDPFWNNPRKQKETCLKLFGVDNFMKSEKAPKSKFFSTKEFLEKSQDTRKRLYGDKNFNNREKAVETCKRKFGVENVSQVKEFQRKKRKFYKYENETFDSSWELALWIYAKDHNEEIIRDPTEISYTFEGKIHKYFPDFLYKGQLIEVKSDFLFDEMQINGTLKNAKLKCMQENNVKIFCRKEIDFYLKYISSVYGNNYLRRFCKK